MFSHPHGYYGNSHFQSCFLLSCERKLIGASSKSTLVISHQGLKMAVMKVFTTPEMAITTKWSLCPPRFPTFSTSALPSLLPYSKSAHHCIWYTVVLVWATAYIGGSPAESIGSFPITCETGIEIKASFSQYDISKSQQRKERCLLLFRSGNQRQRAQKIENYELCCTEVSRNEKRWE